MPGRTRLKCAEIKTPSHRHADLQQKLTSIAEIHRAETNSTSGSVVLYHDPTAVHSIEFLTEVAGAFGLAADDPADIGEWLGFIEEGLTVR